VKHNEHSELNERRERRRRDESRGKMKDTTKIFFYQGFVVLLFVFYKKKWGKKK